MATLYGAASGQSNVNSWSKAMLDCFTDGDDQSWSLRMNLGEPAVTGVQSLGGQIGNAATLLEVGLNFTKSSIDYRDPDTKVGTSCRAGRSGTRSSRSASPSIRTIRSRDCRTRHRASGASDEYAADIRFPVKETGKVIPLNAGARATVRGCSHGSERGEVICIQHKQLLVSMASCRRACGSRWGTPLVLACP